MQIESTAATKQSFELQAELCAVFQINEDVDRSIYSRKNNYARAHKHVHLMIELLKFVLRDH